MKTFNQWLQDNHPDQVDEGLKSWGRGLALGAAMIGGAAGSYNALKSNSTPNPSQNPPVANNQASQVQSQSLQEIPSGLPGVKAFYRQNNGTYQVMLTTTAVEPQFAQKKGHMIANGAGPTLLKSLGIQNANAVSVRNITQKDGVMKIQIDVDGPKVGLLHAEEP